MCNYTVYSKTEIFMKYKEDVYLLNHRQDITSMLLLTLKHFDTKTTNTNIYTLYTCQQRTHVTVTVRKQKTVKD